MTTETAVPRSVTLAADRQDALTQAKRFLMYYPYRIVGIVQLADGRWGWLAGTTMHSFNKLVRDGHAVYKLANNA